MTIVVSGFPRSGTSMMMRALVEGGVRPFYSNALEKELQDSNPGANKYGFYEVGEEMYMRFQFTAALPSNCCVKIMARGLPILSPGKHWDVIYMRRTPSEIKESYEKAFPNDLFEKHFRDWPNHYWALMEPIKHLMEMRPDVNIVELWYGDVIKNPQKEFSKLVASGMEFDLMKACDTVDPTQHRIRHGNLHNGE